MPLLDEKTAQQVKQMLGVLTVPVRLAVFTQESGCTYCTENQQIAEEVAALSDKIEVEVYDFVEDEGEAEALNISRTPAIAVIGSEDFGVRFYGVPGGYEFTSLLQAIKSIGTDTVPLEDATISFLRMVTTPIHLQVFVTPTCPYCPTSVVLAHQMAIASPWVHADMVEATEFPDLSQRYQVMGVPRTVINEVEYLEGAAPEAMVLDKIKEALARTQATLEVQ